MQLERTGCGIASVAALAGVRYKDAQRSARRLGIVATDERLWSETGYVRRLLAHYGLGRGALCVLVVAAWQGPACHQVASRSEALLLALGGLRAHA